MSGRGASLAAALVLALGCAGAWALPPEPAGRPAEIDPQTGYRVQNYRAPVTLPVEGGPRIDLATVDRLKGEGAALIDVMPARGGYDPATGAWRVVDRRETIPGAVWLPEVGRGDIDASLSRYFATSLRRLTGSDQDRPLVFFCMADCWMSWNAVRRAAGLGYRRVHWFAEGTDGWREADRPLVDAEPWPVPLADEPERQTKRPNP